MAKRQEGKKDSKVVMHEIEQRLIDANQILIDINGKIKEVFIEENLQKVKRSNKGLTQEELF